jgi:hypothetical protein
MVKVADTASDTSRAADNPDLSDTRTGIENVPEIAGVPVRAPAELRASPSGSAPELAAAQE